MIKKLLRIYRRIKLTIWAILNLPRELYIADTNYKIPDWNWMVALLCKIEIIAFPIPNPYSTILFSG